MPDVRRSKVGNRLRDFGDAAAGSGRIEVSGRLGGDPVDVPKVSMTPAGEQFSGSMGGPAPPDYERPQSSLTELPRVSERVPTVSSRLTADKVESVSSPNPSKSSESLIRPDAQRMGIPKVAEPTFASSPVVEKAPVQVSNRISAHRQEPFSSTSGLGQMGHSAAMPFQSTPPPSVHEASEWEPPAGIPEYRVGRHRD